VTESYIPRQIQLKSLSPDAGLSNLGQQDTAASLNKEQEFSSHLQNEKQAVSRQIEEVDQELRAKQEELDEQMMLTQAASGAKEVIPIDTQLVGGTQQSDLLRQLKDKTHEVESLSLKIDELQQAQYAAQTRVDQVKRFN
jgi:peptidoglycan hydrolase CwlO-like protein